ncbi:collagen alpha-1(I) chain-like [Cervus elaphus]|uniref:collagen alpha-1(I) chain-like n=1 Tax=Cervus elaphus TaxID=9860 RepID=UPI001CC2D099|nr:collagen alpha-1(I) chain-like [Cervus elaphus]
MTENPAGPASRSSLPPSQHFPQELLWALRSKRETNKSPCPQSHLTVPGSRPMDWGSEALPERRGVELCISILRTPVRLAVQHPGWSVLRSPGQASVQRQLELAAHLPGLGDPDGSPVGPSPDPHSSSSSNARYGLEPPRLSLTCISSALPPTGVLGKPANRTRFSPESSPGPTLNPGVGGGQGPTGRGHTKGVATLRVCTVAHRTLVPWHRGRWQELKALRPEGDEAVGSLPPSATITPADPEGLEAGVPPCGCAESVRRSRTQTPAGSLLCVQTWPGLGQDDGLRRIVDVSEWELTAHLPRPTYAGPATRHPALGWPGVQEGWSLSLGPGSTLACLLAERDRGLGPERDRGQGQERDRGQGSERDRGQGSERDRGQGSEWDRGQGSECDRGQDPECDRCQGSVWDRVQGSECARVGPRQPLLGSRERQRAETQLLVLLLRGAGAGLPPVRAFSEREIGERRQPGGGRSPPLSSSFSPSSASSSPSPRRPAPGSARLAPPSGRGKKARGAGQERGAERRRRRPERERRARRWRRPRRNERGVGEPGAQAAAPRTGRARARAPRIARSPGIRTSRASGGRRQAGGGEGTCARRRVRFPGASRLGLERAGGGGGRRSPRSGRAPVSAAGDAGRSWGFATRPIKSSPAGPLLPWKLRGWRSELGPPPPPPPPPASSGGGDGIWQSQGRLGKAFPLCPRPTRALAGVSGTPEVPRSHTLTQRRGRAPGTPRSPFPAGRGRRPSSAAAQLPRGTSLAPAPSRAGWGSGPGRPPSPASPRGPLGRAQRALGLLREGTAELKIAAKLGGREGLSEDAALSPGTAAGHKHTPPPSSGRAGGVGGEREAGVSFHIRRWNTVYLGSEEAAMASPRACSFLFLGDPRRRRGSKGGRGREPPSPPQAAAKLCVRTPGCRRVRL